MARSADEFRAAHDLLQSLRSLAQGWRVGPDHECIKRRPRDHDAAVQIIATSMVRVHQHGPVSHTTKNNWWDGREAD
jgi:hypothetical protein